jgi:hypothetical protein
MYELFRQLFMHKRRLPIIISWSTSPALEAAASDAYWLYTSECCNITKIVRVDPSHTWVLAAAFAQPCFFEKIQKIDISNTDLSPSVCKGLFKYIREENLPALKSLNVSGNTELDNIDDFRLPMKTRDFSFFYHDTSTSPWALFDILCHHGHGTFLCVSAMSSQDSIPQAVVLMYVIANKHVSTFPRTLILPNEIIDHICEYTVEQLRESCCEIVVK